MKEFARNPAPGALDAVRTFLNSKTISHHTREWVDELDGVFADESRWGEEFDGVLPFPNAVEHHRLRQLRDGLRDQLGKAKAPEIELWLELYPLRPVLDGERGIVRHEATTDECIPVLLALIVDAVADGNWRRLRACPDCRRVFFDRTKNLSRVWCGMYADGPEGRACGTIAKVAAFRERHAGSSDLVAPH